jgi:hypothetical protein
MNAHAILLKPIPHGWAVTVTDGRELARFIGLGAKQRAVRFINRSEWLDYVRGGAR